MVKMREGISIVVVVSCREIDFVGGGVKRGALSGSSQTQEEFYEGMMLKL